jgi:dihydrofolate reductase
MSGKVVVNRSMPLDGFISGPGDAMDGEAVATALGAAGGKNFEILVADVAGQCLRRGLVDEILVHVLPVLLGDGIRFSSPGPPRIDLEPLGSTQSGAVTTLRFRVSKPSADHGRGRQ